MFSFIDYLRISHNALQWHSFSIPPKSTFLLSCFPLKEKIHSKANLCCPYTHCSLAHGQIPSDRPFKENWVLPYQYFIFFRILTSHKAMFHKNCLGFILDIDNYLLEMSDILKYCTKLLPLILLAFYRLWNNEPCYRSLVKQLVESCFYGTGMICK